MNIAELKQQANGERTVIPAVLLQILETGKTAKGKPVQTLLLGEHPLDGEQHKINFYPGNHPLLKLEEMNKVFSFLMWAEKRGKFQNVYVKAFLDNPEPIATAEAEKAREELGNHFDKEKKEEVDWDAIAEGKVRCNVLCAGIESEQIKIIGIPDILYWTEFVMTGKAPLPPQKNPESLNYSGKDTDEQPPIDSDDW